jgi:hypothetical protein
LLMWHETTYQVSTSSKVNKLGMTTSDYAREVHVWQCKPRHG